MSAELYWSRENDSGNYLARNHTLFGVTMESRFISELRWNSQWNLFVRTSSRRSLEPKEEEGPTKEAKGGGAFAQLLSRPGGRH